MPLVGLCRPRRVTFRTSGGSRADTRGLTHASGRDPIEIKNIELGLGDEIKVLGYPGIGGEPIAITSGEISRWWTGDGTEYYKIFGQGGPGVSGGAAFDANTGGFVGIPSAGTVVHWADTLGLIRANKFILQYLEIANNAG